MSHSGRRPPGEWERPNRTSDHVRDVSALIRASQNESNKVSAWGSLMYVLPVIALVVVGMSLMGYFWEGVAQIIGLGGVFAAGAGVLYCLFCLVTDFTERNLHEARLGWTVLRLLFFVIMLGLGIWWFTFSVSMR